MRGLQKKITAFCTTEKNQKFRRPKISFFGIFSYQIIVCGSKIDNFGSWKIALPMMYDLSVFIYFPRSSLRTNKQTYKQKDMLILLIYMTRVSPWMVAAAVISFPVITHSCSPFQFPILVFRPGARSRSRSPFPLPVGASLHTITMHRPLSVTQTYNITLTES